jgi:FkbM family methyltransferase
LVVHSLANLKAGARAILKLACRAYFRERGKFRILNEIYFRHLSPKRDQWITTKLSHGHKMELNISEFLQAHLYLFGSYELPTIRFIRRYLRPGNVVLDVGAQIGYLTIEMATAAAGQSHVYSFEPEPRNIERFNINIGLNALANVELIPKALSNEPSTIKLYLSADHNAGTHSTIPTDPNVTSDFVEVEATTIDHFIADHQLTSADLIKIDVEGAELEVVRGATASMRDLKPTFIIELSEGIQRSRSFSTVEFKELMQSFNYTAFTIADSGDLIQSAPNVSHAMDNVVFIHADRLTSVEHLIKRA